MNADCWAHISTFLSLKEILILRKIEKEIKIGINILYNKRKEEYLRRRRLRALKDWIHRSPLLCCITDYNHLLESRWGYCKRFWDPPLLWHNNPPRFRTCCHFLNYREWLTARYIVIRAYWWGYKLWEKRAKLRTHQDRIMMAVKRCRISLV